MIISITEGLKSHLKSH